MTQDEREEIEWSYKGKFPTSNAELSDTRAIMLNNHCQLLWEKYKGDVEYMKSPLDDLIDHAEDLIRNVYELYTCDVDIPLLVLHYLKSHERDNWCWTEEQHQLAIKYATDACQEFYIL
jgi:hypothetical protein